MTLTFNWGHLIDLLFYYGPLFATLALNIIILSKMKGGKK